MLHVFTNHLAKRIHPMISNIVKPHRETLMLGWTCIAAPSLPAALTHSLLHSYRASSRRFQGTHLTLITGANRASSPLFPAERIHSRPPSTPDSFITWLLQPTTAPQSPISAASQHHGRLARTRQRQTNKKRLISRQT